VAKTKSSKPAATKNVSKPEAASVRPVKETLTKSALINLLAEQNDIPRKTAAAVYAHWKACFSGQCIRAASVSSLCQES
jgi:hypothetical protein